MFTHRYDPENLYMASTLVVLKGVTNSTIGIVLTTKRIAELTTSYPCFLLIIYSMGFDLLR